MTRLRSSLGFLIPLCALAGACGSSTIDPGPLGGGGNGAGGNGGNGGDGGAPTATCTSRAGSALANCDESPCPLIGDVELACTPDDPEDFNSFAALDVRVVTNSTTTYVGATDWNFTDLFEMDADSASAVDGFSLDLDATELALGMDDNGKWFAAGDETKAPDYEGGLALVEPDGNVIREELVFDADDKYVGMIDFAASNDGAPHLWFNSNPPYGRSHATRDADGIWTTTDAVVPSGTDWPRFVLGSDGAPVAFGMAESGNAYQVSVRDGGQDKAFGSAVADGGAPHYRPIGAPLPASDTPLTRYAAVIQHDAGLRVAWPEADSFGETAIPDSAIPNYSCSVGFDFGPPADECPDTCVEQTSGLESAAFAPTRSENGDVWLAYVVSHVDRVVSYELQDIDGVDVCVGNVSSDTSTGELRLVHVPLDGSDATVAFTLPLERLAADSAVENTSTGHRVIDAAAFGSRLAVAVRLFDLDGAPYVRALTFDTSAL